MAAATAWMVVTIVLERAHLVLYPFSQIATDPALSTQHVTCELANFLWPAATATRGQ
jgi:hypothetical protein